MLVVLRPPPFCTPLIELSVVRVVVVVVDRARYHGCFVLFLLLCKQTTRGGSSAVSVPSLVILKHVNERITIDKSETERDSQKSIDRQRERTDIQETAVIAGLARLHHAQLVAVRSSNTKHKVRRDKRREEAKNKADEGGWGSDVDVVVLANGAEAVVTCSSVRVCVCVCTMTHPPNIIRLL